MGSATTAAVTLLGWLSKEMSAAKEPPRHKMEEAMPPVRRGEVVVGKVPEELRPLLWLRMSTADQIADLNVEKEGLADKLLGPMQADPDEIDPVVVGTTITEVMTFAREHKSKVAPLVAKRDLLDEIFWYELRRLLGKLDKDNFTVRAGYEIVKSREQKRGGGLGGMDLFGPFSLGDLFGH